MEKSLMGIREIGNCQKRKESDLRLSG